MSYKEKVYTYHGETPQIPNVMCCNRTYYEGHKAIQIFHIIIFPMEKPFNYMVLKLTWWLKQVKFCVQMCYHS